MSLNSMPEADMTVVAHRQIIIGDLQRLVGASAVIDDEAGRRVFETDALPGYRCLPLAVVLPESTEEISKVLAYCSENRVKVVPRGAGTSLSGGAVPAEDAVVVCLSHMNKVLELDYANRCARFQAGITIQAIADAVARRGFAYGPDPESALACTLGGNLAVNAGGARCLKYGMTGNHVLGLTMVMMDGEVVELGGKYLDAPGYDITALIVGSEGQMGIITEATVRIQRAAEASRPILLGFASVNGAGQCVAAILKAGIMPAAIEFMDKPAVEFCEAHANAGYPVGVEALLIIEVEGAHGEISSLQSRIVDVARTYAPSVVRVSQNDEQSAAIWKGRRTIFGAIGQKTGYICLDGTIPPGRLGEVLDAIKVICKAVGLEAVNIFHAGDGNLHPVILYDTSDPEQLANAQRASEEILRLCVDVGGCLSGENGIGIEKRELMSVQFSATDLAIQMRIKKLFDPGWQLNVGKVFPLDAGKATAGAA